MSYEATTRDIIVRVSPTFVDDDSSPVQDYYFWSYAVEIVNNSSQTVQLRSRYWKITDAEGRTEEVRGAGVVGEQPILDPGESYHYTSGAPLRTPSGLMQGAYQMETEDGESFDVAIPTISLDSPYTLPV